MEYRYRKTLMAFFAVYALGILWLLLVRSPDPVESSYWQSALQHTSFVPFRMIRLYFRVLTDPAFAHLHQWAKINMLGNIVLFIPLGWLVPRVFPVMRRLGRTLFAVLGVILLAELAQMVLLVGTCDVDDLLLNGLGTAIGYGLFRWLQK